MTAELRKINDIIRETANDSSQYELKPHLSLLYKNLAAATRRELAASINVPLSEVTFDAIKAVRCVSPTESGADVESLAALLQQLLCLEIASETDKPTVRQFDMAFRFSAALARRRCKRECQLKFSLR